MKKLVLILISAMMFSLPVISQTSKENHKPIRQKKELCQNKDCDKMTSEDIKVLHDKMMKQKREIFAKSLDLNKDELSKFWTMYEKYDNDIFVCHSKYHKMKDEIMKDVKDKNKEDAILSLSNEQAEQLLKMKMNNEKEILEITNKYIEEFHQVLPPQKIIRLQQEEKHFMRHIMNTCPNPDKENQERMMSNKRHK
ncbi:MAG: hypothetical protein LKE30_00620 [Bacteroidales bacterium]|jgi:hypothetical protein|nr:hypothetical protein [Bacteroidales bacterium]